VQGMGKSAKSCNMCLECWKIKRKQWNLLGIFGFIGCTKIMNDSTKSRYFFKTCAFMPKKKQIYYKI